MGTRRLDLALAAALMISLGVTSVFYLRITRAQAGAFAKPQSRLRRLRQPPRCGAPCLPGSQAGGHRARSSLWSGASSIFRVGEVRLGAGTTENGEGRRYCGPPEVLEAQAYRRGLKKQGGLVR